MDIVGHTINDKALEAARLKIEDCLIDMRDARMAVIGRGNGFCVREKDGTPSRLIRLGTPEGLRMGIEAYLDALSMDDRRKLISQLMVSIGL